MKLRTEERLAILRGDYTALKRDERPDVKAGEVIVLRWSPGGKQFIERTDEARSKAAQTGAMLTIDIPRKPTVWVELAEPQLHGDEWRVTFIAHDEREPTRLLAGPPNPPGEPGLKTRWRPPSKVPKKGAERRSWSSESERGYGGGKASIDHVAGVDDATLSDYARRVEAENAIRQAHRRDMSHKLSEERRLIDKHRGNAPAHAMRAIGRRIDRAEKRMKRASDEAA